MLVLMIISLYTSRIVLQTLGVEDYGLYNIVGGLIVMFTFVSNAMATGTQRHISFELGKKDRNVSKVFSACFNVHLVLAIFVVILGETVGLWFLYNKLVIPPTRLGVAGYVYQFALLSTFISIIRVPFNATIISYEKFHFYAYSSILEGVLKLLIAILLLYIDFDKLIIYASLNFAVVILLFGIMVWYVFRKIPNISLVKVRDKPFYKYIISFTGWTVFGSCANLAESQGLNIVINLFYGVTLNAAVGIATQVKGIFQQLTSSIQASLNPQLVKSESEQNKDRQIDLICKSSKFTFVILYACSFPVFVYLDYILNLWLGTAPSFATEITILMIIFAMMECLSSPLYTTIFAIGNIKKYQIIISIIKLLTIVLAYYIAKMDFQPFYVYLAPCIITIFVISYRLYFLSTKISNISVVFFKKVLVPLFKGSAIGSLPIVLISRISECKITIPFIIIFVVFSTSYLSASFFYFSLNTNERHGILLLLRGIVSKIKNKN